MAKVLSADEVKKHNSSRSVWMVIRNSVYDVTPFLEEHPGGIDPLMEAAGQDATIAFDDVGHSADAINMMKKYKIGTLAPGQGCCKMKPRIWKPSSKYHRECTSCDVNSGPSKGPSICDVPSVGSDEKPWQTYDGQSVSRRSSIRSGYKSPASPKIERRVPCIVVPREPRRGRSPRRSIPPPPESYSKLKWALIALGLAIIIGIAYKRYAS